MSVNITAPSLLSPSFSPDIFCPAGSSPRFNLEDEPRSGPSSSPNYVGGFKSVQATREPNGRRHRRGFNAGLCPILLWPRRKEKKVSRLSGKGDVIQARRYHRGRRDDGGRILPGPRRKGRG